MKKLTRAIAIVVLAAVPVVGLSAAPAGAKNVTPQKWLTSFCTTFGDWGKTIQTSSSQVQNLTSGGDITDLGQAKTTFVDYLNQLVDATESAISDMKAAGTPSVTNGAKISTTIVTALQKADNVFKQAESNAENLSTSDQTAFTTDVTKINSDISTGLNGATAGFSKLNKLDSSKTFNKLSKKIAVCKAIGT